MCHMVASSRRIDGSAYNIGTVLISLTEAAISLREPGAKVQTYYFPKASHDLGKQVEPELRAFLRDNLLDTSRAAAS